MSDAIDRLNAALEGRYQIEREIGEGGMATVFLAKDLRHNRSVALKVLKPELAAVVGAERFLAEIETTANLQHPHILPLFDSGEADGFLFYVMPYVQGETLRERVDREKQLPVDEAVRIATDVAGALHSAHEQGVIHRDIKPANILLSKGRPLVADFGIALAVSHAGGGRLTETGLSMGTPYYMSPEQASADREPTPASDVYSLSCVLYEMLVGDPPHTASSAQAVLAKILTEDAKAPTQARASIPANVDAAIRKALEKLPADRFTGAQDFAKALADPGFRYGETATVGAAKGEGPSRGVTAGLAATAALLAVLAAWGWARPATQPGPVMRAAIDLGELAPAGPQVGVIVSPDGSRFALTGRSADGDRALYWRDAAEDRFRMIPGTGGVIPTGAAFSPDGDWIAYATQNALLKVSLSGGAPAPVVPPGRSVPSQISWGDNGMIVFQQGQGMYRVSETGGETELLRSDGQLSNPSLLPGGWAVIGNRPQGGVTLLDLGTGSMRELIAGGLDPKYVETGHLLYVDESGTLWAAPFDAARGEVLGLAVPVIDGISVGATKGRYSVSRNGTLVYGTGGSRGSTQGIRVRLLVVDLESGSEEYAPLEPQAFLAPRWSPDGESVAFNGHGPGGTGQSDIYIYNWARRAAPRRLTFEGDNRVPVWSPDGTRVAFTSSREGTDGLALFVKAVNDDTPPRMIVDGGRLIPTDWPSDDLLVFENGAPSDLWMVDPSADSAVARPYLESPGQLDHPVISPDRNLAAYVSNESGAFEVYVRSFPEARQPEIVSRGGGVLPHWSPDGRAILYWSLGPPGAPSSLISARIERGPPFVVTSRDTVLTGQYAYVRNVGGSNLHSHVHPDGTRLVVSQGVRDPSGDDGAPAPERFIVVVNWFEELRARLGEGN